MGLLYLCSLYAADIFSAGIEEAISIYEMLCECQHT